LQKLQLFIADT